MAELLGSILEENVEILEPAENTVSCDQAQLVAALRAELEAERAIRECEVHELQSDLEKCRSELAASQKEVPCDFVTVRGELIGCQAKLATILQEVDRLECCMEQSASERDIARHQAEAVAEEYSHLRNKMDQSSSELFAARAEEESLVVAGEREVEEVCRLATEEGDVARAATSRLELLRHEFAAELGWQKEEMSALQQAYPGFDEFAALPLADHRQMPRSLIQALQHSKRMSETSPQPEMPTPEAEEVITEPAADIANSSDLADSPCMAEITNSPDLAESPSTAASPVQVVYLPPEPGEPRKLKFNQPQQLQAFGEDRSGFEFTFGQEIQRHHQELKPCVERQTSAKLVNHVAVNCNGKSTNCDLAPLSCLPDDFRYAHSELIALQRAKGAGSPEAADLIRRFLAVRKAARKAFEGNSMSQSNVGAIRNEEHSTSDGTEKLSLASRKDDPRFTHLACLQRPTPVPAISSQQKKQDFLALQAVQRVADGFVSPHTARASTEVADVTMAVHRGRQPPDKKDANVILEWHLKPMKETPSLPSEPSSALAPESRCTTEPHTNSTEHQNVEPRSERTAYSKAKPKTLPRAESKARPKSAPQTSRGCQPPPADPMNASITSSRCTLDVPIEVVSSGYSSPPPPIRGPQVIPKGATSLTPPAPGPLCRLSASTPCMNAVLPKPAPVLHSERFQRVWTVAGGKCPPPSWHEIRTSPQQRCISPHAHGLRLGSQTPPRCIPVAHGAISQTHTWMPGPQSAESSRSLSPHFGRGQAVEVQPAVHNTLSRSVQTLASSQ